MHEDRRQFQRLRLARPILASMDQENALILDIGMAGAFLEHYGTVDPGHRFRLSFRWQSESVEFECEVVRTTVVREPGGDGLHPVSHSGVHFVEAIGDSEHRLEELMEDFVRRIIDAQRANAAGDTGHATSAMVLAGLGGALRKRARGYVSYRLKDGKWWRVPTESPRQPEEGFTVAAWEDESQVDTLCRTYETADAEGRQLIRVLAELSVRHASS
ncbi:MAG TPA: PilZ domain-containing protein [Thermoanaerobaculia bacterium]|jgi:hypothetical protein|nr:PilZ domain-containing protein [Thermoanaerobaculia bacterium]